MRLLFLGDVVGRAGRRAVIDALPGLRRRYALDFVIVNGENAAGVSASPNPSSRSCSAPAPTS